MTRLFAVLLSFLFLASCGGGVERTEEGAAKFAGKMRATGVVVATTQSATTAVTADMTLDWAEYNFPELFPKAIGIRFPVVVYEGVTYNARLYAGAWGERYLGITPDGRIFGLGDFTGEALQQFNDIDHWSVQILADQCKVNPDSCVNLPPVANAGPLQNVTAGTVVTLNGSASTDAESDPLTFAWTLTSTPAGSTAVLVSATSAAPTFTADVAGVYIASLVVNDGKVNSTAATVTVTATVANAAPVANAGAAQNVVTGTLVTLNGSTSSDANGDTLTFAWTLTSRPAGSTAALASATSARPTFTADVAGTYVARLVVNDGKVNSTAATVTVTASQAPASNVYAVTVSRIDSNTYFSSTSKLMILTKYCYEYVYYDNAILTMTGSTGSFDGTIRFSNGSTCDVDGAYWPSALMAGNYTATLTREESNIYSDLYSRSIIWTKYCYEYEYYDQSALYLAYSGGAAYSSGSVIGSVTFSGGRSCDLIGIFSLARLN